MDGFQYKGAKTKEISFPLGGIGSGCVGLAGNGRLIDWEIFNRPNKGSVNGFSHIAVKAERDGRVLDCRGLQGDLLAPYTGSVGAKEYQGYGFGPRRETLAGMPHFRDTVFEGAYPYARMSFADPRFPGTAELRAWNPLIPLNDFDSSLPAAFFDIGIHNTGTEPIDYTIAFSVSNPLLRGGLNQKTETRDGLAILSLTSDDRDTLHADYGNLCIATDAKDWGHQDYWYRGKWFDSLEIFWQDFCAPGLLKQRTYAADPEVRNDTGTLTAKLRLGAGASETVRFVLAWHFPNNQNYWKPLPEPEKTTGECRPGTECPPGTDCASGTCANSGTAAGQTAAEQPAAGQRKNPNSWKNWYATVFRDSAATALYALKEWPRLDRESTAFQEALFSSTLPGYVLDAVSANISILKSPTCLRLEDGSFYGFEGCHCSSGCCEGSCTHVWNYAYALPFLFPRLERSMRDLDFRYNMREDGGMAFRLQLPLGRERSAFRPCADGQFGGVLKAYRDWKISGNTEWLRGHWETIKKNIAFAWAPTNEDAWDADKDGVLEGRQHHTLDMELFGPNSWLTGMYLGALKAGAEMAARLGDSAAAQEYSELFKRGKKWADKNLFNGEYYTQLVDLRDKSIMERFSQGESLFGDSTMKAYWNEESGEIKYQIGEGCAIDQVLAQWHANLIGLGEIFDPGQVRKALEAIFKHNYKRSFRDFPNPCRIYSLNDEAGVVICDWPAGRKKPRVPAPYSQETMYGFEYQAAVHMIQEGMVEQGLEIIRIIRERFDGEKRNPWNEFECGSNYARSMASYALLNALSGFGFDMTRNRIGFKPVRIPGQTPNADFSCFWSLETGWGTYGERTVQGKDECRLTVLWGFLDLREWVLSEEVPPEAVLSGTERITDPALTLEAQSGAQKKQIPMKVEVGLVSLAAPLRIAQGETLVLRKG
jgi:uncharacterized protein (DUF608 family)